jgi:hypothetical protein
VQQATFPQRGDGDTAEVPVGGKGGKGEGGEGGRGRAPPTQAVGGRVARHYVPQEGVVLGYGCQGDIGEGLPPREGDGEGAAPPPPPPIAPRCVNSTQRMPPPHPLSLGLLQM